MESLTFENIQVFIIFFLPGFISVKTYQFLIATEKIEFSKAIFETIGYSILNYILMSWLIWLNLKEDWMFINSIWFYLSTFITLIITPIIWPLIIYLVLRSEWIKKFIVIHPIKSAWDSFFHKRESYWVIVHLKDGRKIGGKYSKNSFVSSFPRKEEIYLETVWKLNNDGSFESEINGTRGILILGDEIMAIEFKK